MNVIRSTCTLPLILLGVGLLILGGVTKTFAQESTQAETLYQFEAGQPARADEVNHNFTILLERITELERLLNLNNTGSSSF